VTGKQTGSRAQSRHADIHIPLIIVLVPHSSFMLDCSMVDDIIEMTRAIILETSGNFSGLTAIEYVLLSSRHHAGCA